mmetsp:Transcript_74437/g.193458  ORF Transcript_74437/g.193458 Transcript_74437/m.193458 type:complete len:268 (-) Transcript_74437:1268-2071(-)
MELEILLDLCDHVSVVSPLLCKPEDSWSARAAGAYHSQLHPISDGCVFGLAHAPNIALRHIMSEENRALLPQNDLHLAVRGNLECLVVRSILLSFRRHQANVRCVAGRSRIEFSMSPAVVHNSVVDSRVASIGDDELCIAQGVILRPHSARVPNRSSHGGVDNDIRGHMEIGDALARIHIGKLRALVIARHDVSLHLSLLRVPLDLRIHITEAIVRVHAKLCEESLMLSKGTLVKDLHGMPEEDGVRHLHHCGLEVQGPQHILIARL